MRRSVFFAVSDRVEPAVCHRLTFLSVRLSLCGYDGANLRFWVFFQVVKRCNAEARAVEPASDAGLRHSLSLVDLLLLLAQPGAPLQPRLKLLQSQRLRTHGKSPSPFATRLKLITPAPPLTHASPPTFAKRRKLPALPRKLLPSEDRKVESCALPALYPPDFQTFCSGM